jgi:ATP dependent DNA ligase C terminal region
VKTWIAENPRPLARHAPFVEAAHAFATNKGVNFYHDATIVLRIGTIGRYGILRLDTQWALTKEEMKNCVWLKPKLVAQIEFTEWTPDGYLRHSKFVGLTEDKRAREVVREG